MKKYMVPVVVTISGFREIEADSPEVAMEIAQEMTRKELLGEWSIPKQLKLVDVDTDVAYGGDASSVEE